MEFNIYLHEDSKSIKMFNKSEMSNKSILE